MLSPTDAADLEQFVATLRKDYKKLSVRIRELTHSVKCECDGVKLRLHFPAISQGRAKINELVNTLLDYMTTFALGRTQLNEVAAEYGRISEEEYRIKCERLQREAVSLFIKANKATNRNGEAGELLLYLLTEWILEAPQLIAKLALKTDRNVPIFGPDGVHVGFSKDKDSLVLYLGESKLIADVGDAIARAAESIENSLTADSMEYEIRLVSRHIDSGGLTSKQKALLLTYLDPNEDHENYNKRIDVSTCLIGFDFEAYGHLAADAGDAELEKLALQKLKTLSPRLSKALKSVGIENRVIEVFFFPVPSVQTLRDLFQEKIGWNDDSRTG